MLPGLLPASAGGKAPECKADAQVSPGTGVLQAQPVITPLAIPFSPAAHREHFSWAASPGIC